jgi:hypothetical protein
MTDKLKMTDAEIDALLDAAGMERPKSRAQMDLEVCAVFLMNAHRSKEKGKKREETRRLYKSLCEEPGLVDELRRRKMLVGPLIAP